MKYILIILMAFIVSATAQAQSKRAPVKSDTLTITLKVPANAAYNFLMANTINVDTLSKVSAGQVNMEIKPQAQAVSNYVLQSFGKAFDDWAKANKQPVDKKQPKAKK